MTTSPNVCTLAPSSLTRSGLVCFTLCLVACVVSCTEPGSRQDALTGSMTFTASDTATVFSPDLISTPGNERDLAISPDGSEIMYTLAMPDNSFRAIVWIQLDGDRVVSREIAPFSGTYTDIEPFYSPDGKKVFFASTRPLFEGDSTLDYNLWYADRLSQTWAAKPVPLDTIINTPSDEYYPSVTAHGHLYFTASYPDTKGLEDIYVSTKKNGLYTPPVSLDTMINSKGYEFNAFISPDEDLIVFSSYGRADDLGGGDLYYSRRDTLGQWLPARHMGAAVNSAKLDYCPFLDAKTNRFFFTSHRGTDIKGISNLAEFLSISEGIHNGLGNIYVIQAPSALIR